MNGTFGPKTWRPRTCPTAEVQPETLKTTRGSGVWTKVILTGNGWRNGDMTDFSPRLGPTAKNRSRNLDPVQGPKKVKKQPRNVSWFDLTTHWGKFSKGFWKILKEKSSSTLGRLSRSGVKWTEVEIRDSTSTCVIPYWGKFFYL